MEPHDEPDDRGHEPVDRRQFLTEAAGAAGIATVTYFWLEGLGEPLRCRDIEPTRPGSPGKTFNAQEWRTLAAACDRLLPTEKDSPGARSVNAIGYLDALLAEDFVSDETRKLIKDGAATLERRAREGRKAREFRNLSAEQQDDAIRVFETHTVVDPKTQEKTYPGHAWLKKMLSYIFEAFFGDPVHGGNPQEVAWKWAGHRPGFPRPTEKNWQMRERDA